MLVRMKTQKTTTPPFEVQVKAMYVPAESRPDQDYYFFAYRITIKNVGDEKAQLLNRHWIITDGAGQVENVKGAGVIGQQPHIAPGKEFQYESACPLTTPCGSMRGSYEMKTATGLTFKVDIPEFYLVCPEGLH